jgi:hypothetical protein
MKSAGWHTGKTNIVKGVPQFFFQRLDGCIEPKATAASNGFVRFSAIELV